MLKPNVALLGSGDNADGIDPPPVAVHPAAASADGTTTTSTARRPRRRQCTVLIEPPLLISEPPLTRKRMVPRPPAQQTQRCRPIGNAADGRAATSGADSGSCARRVSGAPVGRAGGSARSMYCRRPRRLGDSTAPTAAVVVAARVAVAASRALHSPRRPLQGG